MKRLGDFLERFKKYAQESDEVREVVFTVVTESGIHLKSVNDVVIKNKTVYLKLSPLEKNEVFIKQEKILSALKENLVTSHIVALKNGR